MAVKFQQYLAAVDIGGTKITASIANRDGIVAKVFQPVTKTGPNTAIPDQVDSLIGTVAAKCSINRGDIVAVGVSTCSPFKRKSGKRVVIAPNLCGGLASERGLIPNDWLEIPLEASLSGKYPRVAIENDCVAAVAAERLFGAGQGEDNLVYVTWSTGIGAGAVVDGRIISGKDGNAPEFAHFVMKEDGPMCGCGKRGHLEALSSGVAIAREYGGGVSTEDVFAAYRADEPRAMQFIGAAARYFARGLSAINAVLDTSLIVIGGSVFNNHKDVLLPLVERNFLEESFPALAEGVEIKPSVLEDCLGDLAALSLVMPENWINAWKKTMPWSKAPAAEILEEAVSEGDSPGAPDVADTAENLQQNITQP